MKVHDDAREFVETESSWRFMIIPEIMLIHAKSSDALRFLKLGGDS